MVCILLNPNELKMEWPCLVGSRTLNLQRGNHMLWLLRHWALIKFFKLSSSNEKVFLYQNINIAFKLSFKVIKSGTSVLVARHELIEKIYKDFATYCKLYYFENFSALATLFGYICFKYVFYILYYIIYNFILFIYWWWFNFLLEFHRETNT